MLMFIFMLIALGCAVAGYRWRWGVFAAIVVGLLQDPLRKMVPEVPGYLSMCSVPIWLSVLGMAMASGQLSVRQFLSGFPQLARWIAIFGCYLLVPAVISLSYGEGTWKITLLGALVYCASFLMLGVGWKFPGSEKSVMRVLVFYVLCTAVLLIGRPLDYFDLANGHPMIGTQVFDTLWVTYRTGDAVYMYSGFFRSPDVMGWHAAMVVMVSGVLAIRSRSRMRWVWIAISMWGFLNLWICGRRKMIAMLPVFGAIYLFLIFRFRSVGRAVPVAAMLLLVAGVGWYGVTRTYHETAMNTFYESTLGDLNERVVWHGYTAVVQTVRQAGFFGYGLGMGQQGIHHIQAEKPRLWQEGGLGKMVAELGIPGAVLFLCVGAVLMLTAYHVAGSRSDERSLYTYVGLFSLSGANAVSAVVSAQIFGDLFIILFLVFLTGVLLSGSRRNEENG